MPEGPEIRLAADELASALVGRPALEVFFAFAHLKPYEAKLAGETVTAVEARGKAILTRFANGFNIYSHNQLYGRWLVRDAYDYPETNRQLRLAIHNRHKSALLYSASDIEVLRDDELAGHPFLNKLGPNLLDESVTAVDVVERLLSPRFRQRRLSGLLLDQAFLAGLGNYLRSEILFMAGVHPSLRPADCSPEQIQRLGEAALSLTRQSYQMQGITNDPALVERLRRQGYERSRYRFRVFNREGEPCFTCGAPVVKDIIGGRRLYF